MSRASRLKELLRDSVTGHTGHFYCVPFRGGFPKSSIGVRRENVSEGLLCLSGNYTQVEILTGNS